RRSVLADPAVELTGDVVARPAEVAEADGPPVDGVEPGEDGVGVVVEGAAVGGREAGEGGIAEDTPVDAAHHVEGRPDDAGILAEDMGPGDGHPAPAQGGEHTVLPIDGVGGGEELPGGLPPEHVIAAS